MWYNASFGLNKQTDPKQKMTEYKDFNYIKTTNKNKKRGSESNTPHPKLKWR